MGVGGQGAPPPDDNLFESIVNRDKTSTPEGKAWQDTIALVICKLEEEGLFYAEEGTMSVAETCREAADLLRYFAKTVPSEMGESAWTDPKVDLPPEGRPVFFMTSTAHWAGVRDGDEWRGTDDGLICRTHGVTRWMCAPYSRAYPKDEDESVPR